MRSLHRERKTGQQSQCRTILRNHTRPSLCVERALRPILPRPSSTTCEQRSTTRLRSSLFAAWAMSGCRFRRHHRTGLPGHRHGYRRRKGREAQSRTVLYQAHPARRIQSDAENRSVSARQRFRRDRESRSVINLRTDTAQPIPGARSLLRASTAEAIAPHARARSARYLGVDHLSRHDRRGPAADLQAGSAWSPGATFSLAFSPEREDPGNPD